MKSNLKDRFYFSALSDITRPIDNKINKKIELERIQKKPQIIGLLGEALILSEEIVFDVVGPNLALPVLLEIFDYKVVCNLLEEGVLRFSLCPGVVSYFSADTYKKMKFYGDGGLNWLTAVDEAWREPFESANFALSQQTNLSLSDRKFLAKLVEKNTKTLNSRKIHEEATRLSYADMSSSLGKKLGFKVEDDPKKDLSQVNVRNLVNIAKHNKAYLCMVLNECTDLVSNELAYDILKNRVIVESQFKNQTKIIDNIFEFENIPDVKSLIAKKHLNIQDILKIRQSSNVKNFRKFIKKIEPNFPDIEVIKAYQSEIDNKVSNKVLYKLIKIGSFTTLGAGIGSVGGFWGSLIGGIIANLSLSFTDTFFVDKFFDGWNPKIFIEKEVKSKIDDNLK